MNRETGRDTEPLFPGSVPEIGSVAIRKEALWASAAIDEQQSAVGESTMHEWARELR